MYRITIYFSRSESTFLKQFLILQQRQQLFCITGGGFTAEVAADVSRRLAVN